MSEPSTPQAYAHAALVSAVAGDTPGARDTMILMVDRLGPASLADAIYAWAHDTQQELGVTIGDPKALKIALPDGTPIDIDTMPPPVRWAARLYTAAANGDSDTCAALFASARGDEMFANAGALLFLCASTIRTRYTPEAPGGQEI